MKLTADRKALAAAVKAVATPGGTQPVHSAIRLEAGDGVIELAATNGDLMCVHVMDADVTEPGMAIAPASLLAGFLAGAKGDTVEVTEDQLALSARSGATSVALRCFHPSIWPLFSHIDDEGVLLTRSDLDAISRVRYATERDRTRLLGNPERAGVHLEGRRAIATDGLRLACAELGVDVPAVTIPAVTLERVLAAGDEVTIAVSDNLVTFRSAHSTWTSRVIAAPFPISQAEFWIAKTQPHHLTFPVAELAEAVARMGLLDESLHHVQITLDGDEAVLVNVAVDVGEITDVVPCTGDVEATVVLQHRHLGELLKAHGDDEITLTIDTPAAPILVHSEDRRFTHLLVPVRVPAKAQAAA